MSVLSLPEAIACPFMDEDPMDGLD